MTAARYFTKDYFEARQRFREAAEAADASLESLPCPAKGPGGEELTTEVAWLGPAEADRVLVTISGTHGAEGFCGSGVQVGWFESGLAGEAPVGTALCQIHGINPYGFAWLRRVTEDNVDMNRNFVDHAAPYPVNEGYEALAEAICPKDWSDAVIADCQKVLEAYAEAEGPLALREAISAGQYSHPDGIFFGGHRPTQAADTLRAIFAKRLSKASDVAVIDYHTGLGPRGYGERICVHDPDSGGLARARDWYDGDVTSPALGDSASVEICGFNVTGMEEAAPRARLTAIALEYGTLPTPEVSLALRADNWLHIHGELDSVKGRGIKEQIRAAFYQDQDDWKEMVWERAVETQRLALAGLTGG